MDYLGMLRRMIRAAGRRVAAADEDELAELVRLRAELDAALEVAARGQNAAGRSWAFIGEAVGISKQAAMKRWAERPDERNAA